MTTASTSTDAVRGDPVQSLTEPSEGAAVAMRWRCRIYACPPRSRRRGASVTKASPFPPSGEIRTVELDTDRASLSSGRSRRTPGELDHQPAPRRTHLPRPDEPTILSAKVRALCVEWS